MSKTLHTMLWQMKQGLALSIAMWILVAGASIPVTQLFVTNLRSLDLTSNLTPSVALMLVMGCFTALALAILFLFCPLLMAQIHYGTKHVAAQLSSQQEQAALEARWTSPPSLGVTAHMILAATRSRLEREGTVDFDALARSLGLSVDVTRDLLERYLQNIRERTVAVKE
jgi:hypothetical protein